MEAEAVAVAVVVTAMVRAEIVVVVVVAAVAEAVVIVAVVAATLSAPSAASSCMTLAPSHVSMSTAQLALLNTFVLYLRLILRLKPARFLTSPLRVALAIEVRLTAPSAAPPFLLR